MSGGWVLLIGNYPPDRQESMLRYGRLVGRSLSLAGLRWRLIRPEALLRRGACAQGRLARWLGALDKFLLFPPRLLWLLHRPWGRRPALVHLLDQGNGVYLPLLRGIPHLVTLHDLIAVRAGSGGPTRHPAPRPSPYQRLNRAALARAERLLCVSRASRHDALQVLGVERRRTAVLPNPLEPCLLRPAAGPLPQLPPRYWLHVGSGAWYKNRAAVLRIHARLLAAPPDGEGLAIPLVLLGQPLQAEELALLRRLGSGPQVVHAGGLDDRQLRAAYRFAEGLIFPSLEEGFGWPVLEALAQGCPVYVSAIPPLLEVGGEAVLAIDPADPAAAAGRIAADWRQPAARARRQHCGRRLAARHSLEGYARALVRAYRQQVELG
ncbi:MAG: glycosyltransferase [Synechococcaceae cyanobacterium]